MKGLRARWWTRSRANVDRYRWVYRMAFGVAAIAAVVCFGAGLAEMVGGHPLAAIRIVVPLMFWAWLAATHFAILHRSGEEPPRYYIWRPGL